MKELTNLLKSWKIEAKVPSACRVYYCFHNGKISIYSEHLGLLIGKNGNLMDKYLKIFQKNFPCFEELEMIDLGFYV